jgi:pantoate kinase
MKCRSCSAEVDRKESFEIEGGGSLCASCFIARAQTQRALTGEDRRRLKAAVKEEMGSVLPRETLRQLIEEGYERLLKGEGDFDDEVGRLANEIERIAGLAMCKEMLDVIRTVGDTFSEHEEEIRSKMRRLANVSRRER